MIMSDVSLPVGLGSNILQDGHCREEAWAGAKPTDLGNGVTLLAMQDDMRAYLCVIPPKGSLGTMDLYVAAGKGHIVDLHVSAQVGERTLTTSGWPDYQWNNFVDWYGTPVPFMGLTSSQAGTVQPQFEEDTDRELAIEKRKFGAGPWRLRFEVRALGPNRTGRVVFPAGTSETDSANWLTFLISP